MAKMKAVNNVRQANLTNNFASYEGKREIFAQASCKLGDITIQRHKRPSGQHCYYAVKTVNGVETPLAYVLGYPDKTNHRERFIIITSFVTVRAQKMGIGTAVYSAIINSGTMLVSDWDISEGAHALWASLIRKYPMRSIAKFSDGYVACLPRSAKTA